MRNSWRESNMTVPPNDDNKVPQDSSSESWTDRGSHEVRVDPTTASSHEGSSHEGSSHEQGAHPRDRQHTPDKRRHRLRTTLIVLLVVVIAAVAFRLALPSLVKQQINDRFAQMGDYSGYVDDVDIALWRGAYALNGVDIVKTDQEVPVPFFAADSIELSISWSALWHRAIVAEAHLWGPSLHFVDGEEDGFQGGGGTDWRDQLQQLIPIRIDVLQISDGQVNFHNFKSEPVVHLTLTDVQASFSNISNADRSENAVPAEFQVEAYVFEDAHGTASGSLDPLGEFDNFNIDLRVTDVDLTLMNSLTEAYGNFDFETGTGDLVMELQAIDGQLDGYLRPLLDNVAILDLESDLEQGVLSAAWEAFIGGLGRIFRNQPEDRIAAEVEVSGNLTQQEVSPWQAFLSIMRNAFIEVYDSQFRSETS